MAIFLIMATTGVLRTIGAYQHSTVLQDFGLQPTTLHYLKAAGIGYALLNLGAALSLMLGRPWRKIVAWLCAILSIAWSWGERYLLWAPEQRHTNSVFMLYVHILLLVLIIAFSLREDKLCTPSTNA